MTARLSSNPQTIYCKSTPDFLAWLSAAGGTLAVTTYQAGKLAFISAHANTVHLMMRDFDKPLGLDIRADQLVLACRHESIIFADAPILASDYLIGLHSPYDALFLPRIVYLTGDLNAHEIAFGSSSIIFVNSRFSCLSELSDRYAFQPIWQPRFVSELVPEDRCHLNGLAMHDGRPAFVSALGATNIAGGWRDKKTIGGVLVDVETGETVATGLCMPHSPRLKCGQLFVLNSGKGELIQVDLKSGRCEVVCRLPGYLRGLCFVDNFAVIGLSKVRERHIFGELPIQSEGLTLVCGLAVVDLSTGTEVSRFEFTSGCEELFDVRFIPCRVRPNILNVQREERRQAFPAPDFAYWLRPQSLIEDLS